jgi:alpha-ketoglutarate-dependent taurine dioxygenase
MSATLSALEVVPSGAALGADIVNLDVGAATDADIAAVRAAWLDHLVLRFRGHSFGDTAHLEFAKRFGPLDISPSTRFSGQPWMPEYPEMSRISNIKIDGEATGSLGDGELVWHTDMSYLDEPPTGSLLHAYEVPESGGDTKFLNMYDALATLPAGLRKAIEGRQIKHDQTHNSSGALRKGLEGVEINDVTNIPGAVHPIARTHPETGRQALYLGRRARSYLVGLPVDESEEMLDSLWDHATGNTAIQWAQEWQADDLIMWDNRCVMHCRDSFDPGGRRLMHRTVILGDRPY